MGTERREPCAQPVCWAAAAAAARSAGALARPACAMGDAIALMSRGIICRRVRCEAAPTAGTAGSGPSSRTTPPRCLARGAPCSYHIACQLQQQTVLSSVVSPHSTKAHLGVRTWLAFVALRCPTHLRLWTALVPCMQVCPFALAFNHLLLSARERSPQQQRFAPLFTDTMPDSAPSKCAAVHAAHFDTERASEFVTVWSSVESRSGVSAVGERQQGQESKTRGC